LSRTDFPFPSVVTSKSLLHNTFIQGKVNYWALNQFVFHHNQGDALKTSVGVQLAATETAVASQWYGLSLKPSLVSAVGMYNRNSSVVHEC
jgi:hypothetical protein